MVGKDTSFEFFLLYLSFRQIAKNQHELNTIGAFLEMQWLKHFSFTDTDAIAVRYIRTMQ